MKAQNRLIFQRNPENQSILRWSEASNSIYKGGKCEHTAQGDGIRSSYFTLDISSIVGTWLVASYAAESASFYSKG